MVKRQASLNDMINETFTKIIMGQSIDTFVKLMEDWKKLGGNDMTKEVNDWYKSMQ
jgi:putative aldouronate transport system substrate-binding protein